MKDRRRVWTELHGPIPKDYLIYTLNGQPGDLRPENLAAVPRYPKHQGEVIASFAERIRNLEKKLKEKEK